MSNRKQLTEMQERFLDALEDSNFNYAEAARRAGYSENSRVSNIIASMKDAIVERAKDYLAMNSFKAAKALTDTLENPVELGTMNKIKAATEILDRSGVSKTEKVEHTVDMQNIIILPAKNE